MLFVIIGKTKGTGTGKERISRRASWEYPQGMRLIAEYWLMNTEAALVSVVEADDAASVLRAIMDWDDVFELVVVPAIAAEQGLQLAKQMQAGSHA